MILIHRHINRNILNNLDTLVAQYFFINNVLDILQLFFGHSSKVRKIKSKMIGSDQRSRLLHMLAQHFAKPRLQQMRSRVIAHGRRANCRINHGINLIAHAEGTPPFRVFCGG